MSTKFLGMGLNAYPGNELNGCINDAKDTAMWAKMFRNFDDSTSKMRVQTDSNCRTKDFFDGLAWLKDGAVAGDLLLFDYSGHGATNVDKDGILHDVICPIDFDWSWEKMITNDQFKAIFSDIPPGVIVGWISDSCHSGDLYRGMHNPVNKPVQRPKRIEPPEHSVLADRIRQARNARHTHKRMGRDLLNVQFIGGCRTDQLSADTEVDGRPGGACTQYLLPQLRITSGLKYATIKIVTDLNSVLDSMSYDQNPVAGGLQIGNVFMSADKGLTSSIPGVTPPGMNGMPFDYVPPPPVTHGHWWQGLHAADVAAKLKTKSFAQRRNILDDIKADSTKLHETVSEWLQKLNG